MAITQNHSAPLNKKELANVIENATLAFAKVLNMETQSGAPLAKADPGQEAPAEKNPEGSSSSPPQPEASASAPATDGDPATGAPPTPPAMGGSPDGSSPPADGAAPGGEVTVEQIKAEADQMDVEELKKYFLAFKASLMEKMGGAGEPPGSPDPAAGAPPPAAGGPPGAPPPAAASPSPSPDEGVPPMGKGEFDDKSGKVSEGSMSKSEKEEIFARLGKAEQATKEAKDENERLRKALADKDVQFDIQVAQVAKGIEALAKKTGLRKSVATSAAAAVIPKPGSAAPLAKTESAVDVSTMSRAEIVGKLNEVTRNPKLTKSDRADINQFVAGNAPVEKVVRFL